MSEDEELRRLRERRLAEAQAQQAGAQENEEARRQQEAQAEAQKEALLRQILDTEARERLHRVRIARPDQAKVLEGQLIQLAQSGRLGRPLTDDDLKALLAQLFPPQRDINIRRKGSIDEG